MRKKVFEIPLKTIIRECGLSPELSYEYYDHFSLENRENIHHVFKYKKFNDDFVSRLAFYCDDNNFMGVIKPSYDLFLNELIKILNLDVYNDMHDDEKLTNKLLGRVEVLKSIKTEKELRKQFPLLFRDLISGRRYLNNLERINRYSEYGKKQYYDGIHYYYSCALKRSLNNFIKTQVEMYTRYINKRKELKEIIEKTSFNHYIKLNFNIHKFAMYLAFAYLTVCERSNERKEIIDNLRKVEMYLNTDDYNKDVTITLNNKLIDIQVIKNKYKMIKDKINNENIVDWVLIPEGRDLRTVTRKPGTKDKITLMNCSEIEKLQEFGKDKNDFYESTNYIAKVIGLGKYNGYVGYIYENGEVILDMEYDDNRPRTAKGNAIYNLNVVDFETLSRLDKQKLIKHPRVKRFCHVGTWKEIVTNIISEPATEEDVYNSHLLVKKLKRKASY